MSLYEITGLFGDALKALEAEGIPIDDRTARIVLDKFCDLYKKTRPESSAAHRSAGRGTEQSRRSRNAKEAASRE